MSKRKSKILLGSIVAAIAVLLLGRAFVLDYYEIPQNGMYPGLPADSLVFGYKLAYSNPSDVQRGDIVIFKQEVKGQSYTYIWRVVGLPGETVEAAGESLVVDGEAAKRDRVRDHFFVMGDNRFRAKDSRSFGPIPFNSIVARKL